MSVKMMKDRDLDHSAKVEWMSEIVSVGEFSFISLKSLNKNSNLIEKIQFKYLHLM